MRGETKTVKEQKGIQFLATKENQNVGWITKTAQTRTVKYTYIISVRENCCEADWESREETCKNCKQNCA